jgi:hypothetical protein
MQEKFITHELALELLELGFDEPCFTSYNTKGVLMDIWETPGFVTNSSLRDPKNFNASSNSKLLKDYLDNPFTTAPTWQDALDWFDKTYGLFSCFFKANTLLLKENYYVFYITDKNNVDLEEVEERYDVILEKAHQEIEGNYVNAELHDNLIFEEKYGFKTVVEARLECIKKLIEIAKSK